MTDKENVASLMARKDYARAIPLLRREIEKYPTDARLRLQLADALAGNGDLDEALTQYNETAKFYENNGLMVQSIAVRKKAEQLQNRQGFEIESAGTFDNALPKSSLFEELNAEERDAVVREMTLETYNEGDLIISEGDKGKSLYIVASGEVNVYTQNPRGEDVFLAKLAEGDFFGEVSLLTGKPRTATITAVTRTELLRLDKDKLDDVVKKHPRIRDILDQIYRRRASQTVEAMIESIKGQRGAS